ncbi:MAG: alpha/beta fold hydrolase, partial [Lysobacterales bacterium]
MVGPALQSFVECGLLAGIVTLTSRGGEIVQAETIGWSDIETNTPMRSDTLFRIASMTKPITSVAALMLMEQGKIALQDPISRWVPELASPRVLRDARGALNNTVHAQRAITVEDLLTHRSGIAYAFFSEGPLKQAYEKTLGNPALNRSSPDQWLSALGTLPLAYQPGERFHYGHSTDVLGFLIGRVEGMPLRQVLQERIFSPLGMVDTDFWLPHEKRSRLASVYKYEEETGRLAKVEPEMYDEPPAYTPGGGGLISSAADYHRFARLLLGGGALDGVRLLQPETVRLMQTNRLNDSQRQIPFAGMDLWRKSGFGLGLSTAEDPIDNPYTCGAPGSVTWPGIFGTWWQADPVNDLIMIYLIQHEVPVSAGAGSTIATGVGASGRRALPVYQHGIYAALRDGYTAHVRKPDIRSTSAEPRALTEGYADADGDRIHYVEQGSGSPVLLLHGAFGSGTNFIQRDFGAFLAGRHRVIAPDSLAHGESDAPVDRGRYGARQRAFQLTAVLDALGIERLH